MLFLLTIWACGNAEYAMSELGKILGTGSYVPCRDSSTSLGIPERLHNAYLNLPS